MTPLITRTRFRLIHAISELQRFLRHENDVHRKCFSLKGPIVRHKIADDACVGGKHRVTLQLFIQLIRELDIGIGSNMGQVDTATYYIEEITGTLKPSYASPLRSPTGTSRAPSRGSARCVPACPRANWRSHRFIRRI